jgi:transcriptional regulator with XRE-family HTH domain
VDELELLNQLGSRIREIRQEKGMAQNELASKCNFENASLSRIESGKTNLTLRSLHKICKALDIYITDLFLDSN